VRRVLVVGLDCATPQFVFGDHGFRLPTLSRLMAEGTWGRLRSCDPPITVPAWSCMMSGRDPGRLGVYGFRNRRDHSYDAATIATAQDLPEPRLWDFLSEAGKDSILLGIPQTFPPRPLRGCMVSGLLTPDVSANFTYPPELRAELLDTLGEYIIDVDDFRTEDKAGLLKRIHRLMENRFDAALYLAKHKPWDFFMMVEMGVDRLHHGFWQYADPQHPLYEAGNPFEGAIRDFYEALDRRLSELLALVGPETAVVVVSDHGARALEGGFCLNEWLIHEGYLVLNNAPPDTASPLDHTMVDWARTRAWAWGGYYGRVFLNVEGREPLGTVAEGDYEDLRDEIATKLAEQGGPDGRAMGNRALKPEELYSEVRGVAPDLLVYLGELAWRAVGTVGGGDVFTEGNDTGPDGANHDFDGIFIMSGAGQMPQGELSALSLYDVAPTLLDLMGVAGPGDLMGKSLVK
jgi:predicted AlkP superfamily phosphohydrolase/phosphomutase